MCVDMCAAMCVDMCAAICAAMCADMRADMCLAVTCGVDTCAGMCVDMCLAVTSRSRVVLAAKPSSASASQPTEEKKSVGTKPRLTRGSFVQAVSQLAVFQIIINFG